MTASEEPTPGSRDVCAGFRSRCRESRENRYHNAGARPIPTRRPGHGAPLGRIFRDIGHHVTLSQSYGGAFYEILIALHARCSAAAIQRFRRERPEAPLVVALTGTDLYRDLPNSRQA
jgi:hypothetical protein